MIITLSVILIILVIIGIYDPYIDCFYDYRGKYHIILWYNDNINITRKFLISSRSHWKRRDKFKIFKSAFSRLSFISIPS